MWIAPFGHLRIMAYLQLPAAFRSLSRPSSAPDAKAFALRPSQLDLCVILGSLFGNCSFVTRFILFKTNQSTSYLIRSFTIVQFSMCSLPSGSGGLKWTRTTDLTLIRRTL